MVERTTSPGKAEFYLQKVYIRDVSFEAPNTPTVFAEEWQPLVDMDVSHKATALGHDQFEVVLAVSITVTVRGKNVYLVEIQQAGLFRIKHVSQLILDRILATTCANILFPFVREAVADLVTRAGFPQFLLQPINFEGLYSDKLREKGEDTESETGTRKRYH